MAALILLCMGLYFLFPACQTLQQIQTEKNTPYELAATTNNSNIDLNTLMEIENVERVSPVVNLSATLSLNEYKLDCEIRAVYSSFLSIKFTQGTMYPDSSNMPYLILNKAAAKAFSHEYQTVTVSPEDTLIMNANGTERKAIICGIFNDGREKPTVYMSYDAAQKEYGTRGQTELLFLLNNMGSAKDVVTVLQRQGIYAGFDSNLTLAWELLQKQYSQTGILSFILLICAIILIREKRTGELVKCRFENLMLLLTGMTASYVEVIYAIRIFLAAFTCFIIATLAASIFDTISLLGVVIGQGSTMVVSFLITVIPGET